MQMAANDQASVRAALGDANILEKIFQNLNFPNDVCRLAPVCRQWRDAAANPRFWRNIDVSEREINPDVLCTMLHRHQVVESLDARHVELTTAHLTDVLPLLTHLEHLEFEKSNYSIQDVTLLSQNLPRLSYLFLGGGVWGPQMQPPPGGFGGGGHAGGPGAAGWPLHHHPDNEEDGDSEDDDDDHGDDPLGFPPHLLNAEGGLIVNHPGMHPHPLLPQYHPVNCPRLHHPTLRSLVIRNSAIPIVSISCPNLTKLYLRQVYGNKICIRGCTALQELHLHGGLRPAESFARCLLGIPGGADGHISRYIHVMNNNGGLPLQSLQTLVLESNQCITDSMLEACATRLVQLTRLELRHCANIVGEGLRGREPQAGNAAAAAGVASAWENLQELHIIGCNAIVGTTLSIAVSRIFALRSLYIEGCTALASFSIDSRSLGLISLRYPENLSNLELFTPQLHTFDLFYNISTGRPSAPSLRHLTINSANLNTLSLAGCPLLNDIELACAYLHELELIECDALTSTGSHLNALHSSSDLPLLQHVSFHACHMLSSITICCPQVREVKISACRELSDLCLKCNLLSNLELADCSYLAVIEVSSREMPSMSLGCCPSLEEAMLAPLPNLEVLDFRGCNQLRTLILDCPALRAVDASLCSSFTDEAIAALARCPNLQQLKIGACNAVTADGIAALGVLQYLNTLDVSYMPLQDPGPLFESIRGVTSLRLSDNYAMEPEPLCRMIRNLFNTSEILRNVDVSYCNIGPEAAAELAVNCKLPVSLAVNGIRGAPGDGANQHQLWPNLHQNDHISEVIALSMVHSRGLDAFYLGLVPKSLAQQHNLLGVAVYEQIWTGANEPFLQVETPLKKVEELNLGIGEYIKVAIALPHLRSLQLNNCQRLSEVTLHCPNLTRLSLAACRSMSAEAILTAVRGCPLLKHIDISLAGPGITDIEALCARIRQQQGAAQRAALEISISTPLRLNAAPDVDED